MKAITGRTQDQPNQSSYAARAGGMLRAGYELEIEHTADGASTELASSAGQPGRPRWLPVLWVLAGLLPLIGLISLLLRSQLDPHLEDHKVHFVVFLCVGVLVWALAYQAGEAASRRGDARVLLISLAFLATGGFLGLHALGTPGILFSSQLSGFEVAIPVGLLVAAVFAFVSAFVDCHPALPTLVMRRRAEMRRLVMAAMGVWSVWTLAKLPPLDHPTSEGASDSLLAIMAGLGVLVYGVSATRYWFVYRGHLSLLPASVIACFSLAVGSDDRRRGDG